jgi:farnesyl-diphosphate farnesyltransferase
LALFAGLAKADRERTCKVVETLIAGMELDLLRFPSANGSLIALATLADLDECTYFAAGCVGEYWTQMTSAHVATLRRLKRPDLLARGVRLGKALQMVNVIRDCAADLRLGRCYWPIDLLSQFDTQPNDLLAPTRRLRARPVVERLIALALDHMDAAFPYVMAIPRSEPRLRLAALWPLWIGLETLNDLAVAPDILDPTSPVKISRVRVYRIISESLVLVTSDTLLSKRHEQRRMNRG